MRIITEIGDFNRFATAGEFASYLGLTPSEYSSGESQVKGSLTKMGNGHVRKTLIEAAQSATKGVPGRKSKRLIARQSGNDPKVIHYADKGNTRFISKFKSMMNNGKTGILQSLLVPGKWLASSGEWLRITLRIVLTVIHSLVKCLAKTSQ